jgi:hypothetical protein
MIEPPPDAWWRPILDHQLDGKPACGWVAGGNAVNSIVHVPAGATLYLVPNEISRIWPPGPWPGPQAPRPGERYDQWRQRAPHLPTGFVQASNQAEASG